jgi:hypothetical protein
VEASILECTLDQFWLHDFIVYLHVLFDDIVPINSFIETKKFIAVLLPSGLYMIEDANVKRLEFMGGFRRQCNKNDLAVVIKLVDSRLDTRCFMRIMSIEEQDNRLRVINTLGESKWNKALGHPVLTNLAIRPTTT